VRRTHKRRKARQSVFGAFGRASLCGRLEARAAPGDDRPEETRLARLSDIRKAALALPGAAEVEWYGQPGFNVGKKTFVCCWGAERRWIFKLPRAHQDLLFEVRPDVFQPFRAGAMIWAYVDLKALTAKEARLLAIEAWSTIVPKKISRPYLAVHAPEVLHVAG
jgi:hypothetical protein